MSKDEMEVRREDQDKINKFSQLHQRELTLEEELKVKAVRISHRRRLAWTLIILHRKTKRI